MAKITDKMAKWQVEKPGKPWFSFEYFPPKTELGVANLYERFNRMAVLNPLWIDVTWGAGGSTADKTMEICLHALKYAGLDVMMHLTCTNITKDQLHQTLTTCKDNGICNILALRGDPPAGMNAEWKQVEGGFSHATDLVRYIREHFGDYFCVAVAGYPEGHIEAESREQDFQYLKEKVDAGADLVVTQLFYDNEEFFQFVDKTKALGITVPILPGIMPIQSYSGFVKMTTLSKTKLQPNMMEELEPIKDDDQAVKAYGVKNAVEMCKELIARGSPGIHFYTLNLETTVMKIIQELGLVEEWKPDRELPWKQSVETKRQGEDVRPIFWANRPQSYLQRTETWDDYPNGRFGNSASPAFGDCGFVSFGRESEAKVHEERKQMWGTPLSVSDISSTFIGFIRGTVKRLPWCQDAVTAESNFIMRQIVKLNHVGLLTINSQPRVNGALSTDPYVGWGPKNGFVYQKTYLECFISKDNLDKLLQGLTKAKYITYTAVNRAGEVKTNVDSKSVNAVTWGVFPGKEVMQPTVVDFQSFLSWKDEAFMLWNSWKDIYEESSPSRAIIEAIQNDFFLLSIVDNNFVSGDLANDMIHILE